MAVGGGGGGSGGYYSGGGGGYVKCATQRVEPNKEYGIVVGKGGRGANTMLTATHYSHSIQDCTNGERSAFANLLIANGGNGCSSSIHGDTGGTGSGANCRGWYGGRCKTEGMGGRGGSGGSNGGLSTDGITGGTGQGQEYLNCLATAKKIRLTPGEGGAAVDANCKDWRDSCWGPGSGGGGVFVNGQGPTGYDGTI